MSSFSSPTHCHPGRQAIQAKTVKFHTKCQLHDESQVRIQLLQLEEQRRQCHTEAWRGQSGAARTRCLRVHRDRKTVGVQDN